MEIFTAFRGIVIYSIMYRHDLLVTEGGGSYSGELSSFPSSLGNLECVTRARITVTGPRTVTRSLPNEILRSGTWVLAEVDVSGVGLDAGISGLVVDADGGWSGF